MEKVGFSLLFLPAQCYVWEYRLSRIIIRSGENRGSGGGVKKCWGELNRMICMRIFHCGKSDRSFDLVLAGSGRGSLTYDDSVHSV